ncbi:DNA-binding transcriptional regulator (plasmid) [Thermus thermophilus]|uniref:helix-turn-helix transcriptional regulator n=1 Tax=Thermus thermophilus TaxID=274 RepID=UPI001C7950F2|nr:transcriptional regulator [Thermus thermophilus]BCZ93072.1 DNA-binding transcriptional regulator [Thermus thermophilus]BDG30072.1 DNA-binding transcriptional regulator [Thermus thermophilus]
MGQEAKSARLLQMAEALKLRPMRVGELARRFGVSERTVERDLEALLDLGFPVERLARGLYRIADRPPSLHPIEALALFAAGRLLYHQAPTRQYRLALDKLARMLPEPLRGLLLRSTQGLEARQGESRTLEMVARALLERRVLAFEYRSGGSKNWRPKELLVYFLEANRANLGLYAIGYERTYHRAVLTFKLSRMRHARLLDETYEIPPDFDPNAYLRRAWGVVGVREEGVEVRLRFAPEAAWRVLEGDYPGLHLEEELPDGSLLARLEAAPFKGGVPWEVLAWVQSFGPRVEVLSPPELRRLWLEEAERVLALYGNRQEVSGSPPKVRA